MTKEEFLHPENVPVLDEAQVPFWFWNDALEDGELDRQLHLMTEAGIRCCAPHARTGFRGEYLDSAWMDHFRQVLSYKRARGETAWIYDEFNWPSGIAGGAITKEEALREKYLVFERVEVPAGTLFRAQAENLCPVPADMEAMYRNDAPAPVLNLFPFDAGTMAPLDAASFMVTTDYEGMSTHDFELTRDRDTVIFIAHIRIDPYIPEGQLCPDYLNPEAAEKFVRRTHEAYYRAFPEYFGTTIRAAFDDETRLCHAFPWTEGLPEAFRRAKGYDLLPHLPDLVIPGDEAGRTRCDYYDVVADMYRENYHGVLNRWCRAHGIDHCPHFLGEETLAGQVRFCGEYLRQIRETGRPAVDHLGKGIGSLNIKFASSAADLYGKDGLACEVFGGSGWDLTFRDYIRIATWLFSQGVQTIVNHGFFYSTRDFRRYDWPPSQFFQWQDWDRMPEANRYIRRCYGVLKDSKREAGLLICHPVETYWLHYLADQHFTHGYARGPLVRDARAAEIDHKEQLLLTGLQMKNIDYTVFASDAVSSFVCRDGKLVNRLTGQVYRAFLLPMCEVLPRAVAELLLQFVEGGGHLLVTDCVPRYAMQTGPCSASSDPDLFRRQEDDAIREIFRKIMANSAVTFAEDASDAGAVSSWYRARIPQDMEILSGPSENVSSVRSYPAWVIDPYMHGGEDITGISWCVFRKGSRRRYFFVNYTDAPQELTLRVRSSSQPEVLDPMTGAIRAAKVTGQAEDGYRISLVLQPGYGSFLTATV